MRARMWLFLVVLLVTVGLGVVVHAPPASACSCMGTTDAHALAQADVVFAGEVVVGRTDGPLGAGRTWVFAVDEVHKGEADVQQAVIDEMAGTSCTLELPAQGRALVFATRRSAIVDGVQREWLSVSSCGGTRMVADLQRNRPPGGGPTGTLPPGSAPTGAPTTTAAADDEERSATALPPPAPPAADDPARPWLVIGSATGLAAIVIGAALVLVRRRRSPS